MDGKRAQTDEWVDMATSVAIQIFEARNLRNKGIGMLDPYAVMKLETKTYKTKTLRSTTFPRWSETFVCAITDLANANVRITVFKRNLGIADSELHTFQLPLAQLQPGGVTEKLFRLYPEEPPAGEKKSIFSKLPGGGGGSGSPATPPTPEDAERPELDVRVWVKSCPQRGKILWSHPERLEASPSMSEDQLRQSGSLVATPSVALDASGSFDAANNKASPKEVPECAPTPIKSEDVVAKSAPPLAAVPSMPPQAQQQQPPQQQQQQPTESPYGASGYVAKPEPPLPPPMQAPQPPQQQPQHTVAPRALAPPRRQLPKWEAVPAQPHLGGYIYRVLPAPSGRASVLVAGGLVGEDRTTKV